MRESPERCVLPFYNDRQEHCRDSAAPLGVVDIGSNTVRLVIYDSLRCNAKPILNEKVQCGLGSELTRTGRLPKTAMTLALRSLERYKRLTDLMGVNRVDLLATEAVREATNGRDFTAEVEKICGNSVKILSGKDEARLSGLGVLSGVPDARGFAADLGGGSLELCWLDKGDAKPLVTLPVGPLRLMEFGVANGKEVRKYVDDALARCNFPDHMSDAPLYLVGGAWRAFAKSRMERTKYPLRIIHDYMMDAAETAADASAITAMSREKVARLPGVPSKRRKALPYASLVMARLIDILQPSKVVFSACGLREGWLHELLPPEERSRDPLVAAASEYEAREGRCSGLGDRLFRWTSGLFPDEDLHGARLRHAACLLSDIGWHDHPDHRGIEAMSRILRIGLPAVDHPGLAFLAIGVFHRYGGAATHRMSVIEKSLLKKKDIGKAVTLGSALRLAYELSGGVPAVLDGFGLHVDDGQLGLSMPSDGTVPTNQRWQRYLKSLQAAAKSM